MTPNKALKIYNSGQESVVETLCNLSQTVESQQKEIKILESKVIKLSKNSSTSSKPPSSDIIKPKTSKKKKGGKCKAGGQPGHPKHERALFPQEQIDDFFSYRYGSCPECNGEVTLSDAKPRIIQQMEIVNVPIIKQEHCSYPVWCENCQKIHYKPIPPSIVKEGLFKERITALVAYMKCVCHASFSTIRKFIRDVLGEEVSRGYLRKIIEKVSESLEGSYNELLERLPLETVLNIDETGHKEKGDRFWTWVFKAELYVLFKIDKSRGSKVLIDVLGEDFNGVLCCDYFSAYRKYMKDFNVTVQFCVAHLIRDIKFLTTVQDTETKAYGKRLLKQIKNMFKLIHESDQMSQIELKNKLEQAKEKIMTEALENVPSCLNKEGKEQKREAKNVANRFRKHGKEYFEFITTPGVDPTNNAAEQAVRFIVIDRLVTQGTRSSKGRKSNERLWTVVGTCSLQGRSAFNFILKSVKAYFSQQPAPSLLPTQGNALPIDNPG